MTVDSSDLRENFAFLTALLADLSKSPRLRMGFIIFSFPL